MNENIRTYRVMSYFSILLTASFFLFFYAIESSASDESIHIPHEELEWADIAPFVQMSSVKGDMNKGEHGTIGKMKPGMKTPVHTHSSDYHGVVISGTMTHQFTGEDEAPKLGAGSYWYTPAGKAHFTTCYPEAPCIFYIHSDEKFDMTEIEEK